MKLVDDAKQAWKWFSIQAMTLAGAIQGAWLLIPDDMKTSIPQGIIQWITLLLLILGVAGRVVDQK
jgi:hypothetical protein